MFRSICSAAILAATAVPVAAISNDHMIKSIEVVVDLQSIDSPVAAEFWANLEGDLEAEIAAQVTDHIAEEGADGSVIVIDINEFEISNSFGGALGIQSALLADVDINNEADPTMNNAYALKVTVDESGKFETTEDGLQIVTHERDVVYQAMVDTFANGVVKRLR